MRGGSQSRDTGRSCVGQCFEPLIHQRPLGRRERCLLNGELALERRGERRSPNRSGCEIHRKCGAVDGGHEHARGRLHRHASRPRLALSSSRSYSIWTASRNAGLLAEIADLPAPTGCLKVGEPESGWKIERDKYEFVRQFSVINWRVHDFDRYFEQAEQGAGLKIV
jgi:hypothetical protein